MTIGFDTLAALRRTGLQPHSVHVDTDVAETPWQRRNFAQINGDSGDITWQVAIDPAETIGRIDLRPLQGLLCQVSGVDVERVAAVTEACITAGASRVIASTFRKTWFGRDLQLELTHQTDTEGVFIHAELPA